MIHIRSYVKKNKFAIALIISIIVCIILLESKTNYITFKNSEYIEQHKITKRAKPLLKDELKLILNCSDRPLKMETLRYGHYWLLKNYIPGRLSKNMECSESITYTTQGDYSYLKHVPRLVERWLAPISLALFAAGTDYKNTMNAIQYLRNCLPESQLIRDYVSFHIYFPTNHVPSLVALNEAEALKWPYNCQWVDVPYEFVNRTEMYKSRQNLMLSINVGRNIARKAANTYFIFACDIELYPSLGLVDKFLKMIFQQASLILQADKPKVFAMPIFEIVEHSLLPDSKKELQRMFKTAMAVPFRDNNTFTSTNHHLVPNQYRWLQANDSKDLKVFTVANRYGKFSHWEPFYISDNKEPLFDERVIWEGKYNSRIHNYAMCLMDYEYHVLHPAFLVYSQALFDNITKNTQTEMKYATATEELIQNKIKPDYLLLYGINAECNV